MIDLIQKASAALNVNVNTPDGGILGLAKQFGGTNADLSSVMSLIEKVIQLALGLAGVFALVMFLYGGVFNYVFSFGNEEKIKKASQTMIWSFLGLVIIAASYTILGVLQKLFK